MFWSEVCIVPLLQPLMCVKQRVLLVVLSVTGVVAVVFIVTAALTVVVVVILFLRSRGQHYSTSKSR